MNISAYENFKNIVIELIWNKRLSLAIISILLLIIIIMFPTTGILTAIAFVLFALLIGRKKGSFNLIGFIKQKSWKNTFLYGMFLGIIFQLLYSIIFDPLIEKITGIPIDISSIENMRGNFITYIIWLLIGFGFGGFLEEMTFRGYLITRLKLILGDSSLSLTFIILLTSISFGLAHMYQGWSGVISTGSFALIFGIIFIKSNYNLWLPILTHGFANVVGITLIYSNYDIVLNRLLF